MSHYAILERILESRCKPQLKLRDQRKYESSREKNAPEDPRRVVWPPGDQFHPQSPDELALNPLRLKFELRRYARKWSGCRISVQPIECFEIGIKKKVDFAVKRNIQDM